MASTTKHVLAWISVTNPPPGSVQSSLAGIFHQKLIISSVFIRVLKHWDETSDRDCSILGGTLVSPSDAANSLFKNACDGI